MAGCRQPSREPADGAKSVGWDGSLSDTCLSCTVAQQRLGAKPKCMLQERDDSTNSSKSSKRKRIGSSSDCVQEKTTSGAGERLSSRHSITKVC